MQFIVGVDEVGRGPLAGPVAVGAVAIPTPASAKIRALHKKFFQGIKDSKQLTPDERELWYSLALESKKRGELNFRVSLVSEKVIDRHGISYALKLGIKRCLKGLNLDLKSQIFLDGSLRAPKKFKHQLTVIKGDEKISVISLASIVAKVVRDRLMVKVAKKFPEFNFEINKGYGTLTHRRALEKYGLTAVHRRTFLTRLTVGK